MILPKVLQSLQNVHIIIQRWVDHFLPNPEKRQAREILLLICRKCHEEETGGYVHVMQVFERNEEYTDWCMAASVFYHEKTDSFEVWDW